MAKKRRYSIRERLIVALGGALKRNRKRPAPENKAVLTPEDWRVFENKSSHP